MKDEAQKSRFGVGALLRYVVPAVISVGLCWLLFRDFDFGEMWHVIRTECRFGWIALMLVISVFSHIFRALRWRIQLRALGIRPPLFYLVLSIFGTYAVNLVFPRLGELWRTGYVARRQNAPFATVFGSMVADRLADTVTVLLLVMLTVLVASHTIISYLVQDGAAYDIMMATLGSPWIWLGALACAAGGWWLMAGRTTNRLVLKLRGMARELWQGFAVIATMPGKGLWLVYTVGIWGCYFMQMYVAFYAFPFTEALLQSHGAVVALVAFVMSSVSMGVPSNGGIGPWQWAVIFALGIYGLPERLGATFANLVLGTSTLLVIVLGLFTFICVAFDKKHAPAEAGSSTKKPTTDNRKLTTENRKLTTDN